MILINKLNIDNATITASTEHASYKFTDALRSRHRATYGRTTAITGQYIDIDLGTPQSVEYFALVDDNLSNAASITLSANTVNDLANPVVTYTISNKKWTKLSELYDTAYNIFYLVDESGNNIVDENGNYITGYTSSDTYRYWRVSLSDAANTNTYLQLSKIFLSTGVQFPLMAKNQKLPTASTSTVTKNPTGQIYGDEGYIYRYGNITFPYITDAEKATTETAFRAIDKIRPVLIAVWGDDTDTEPPVYSHITTDLDWQRVDGAAGRIWSLTFGFEEMF